ncbi:nitrate ABC transporter substrate-binding protein [Halobacteriales archaeon QS_6_64_34]|nr:MAG: nitrate ABC transporter substrate-binding protein [Halobacteriales archaeon QS_6_64_34]
MLNNIGEKSTSDSKLSRNSIKQSSRRKFLGAVGTGVTLGLAGCAGGESTTTVTVGYQPFGTPYWSELVVKHGELAEQYMPDGYETEWQSALQGTVIGNRMISGENQIGYNGDMPTLIALAQDDKPIASTALSQWSYGQQCNAVILSNDVADQFNSVEDLDGAAIGATSGACSHRALLKIEEEEDISIDMQDLDINTILAQVSSGDIDGGIMWEPNPTMAVVQQETAEFFMTTARYGDSDTGSITMTDEFIEDHPDAAAGFMKGELEAKNIMQNDPERAVELIKEEEDLAEYEPETCHHTLYEEVTPDVTRSNFVTDLRQCEPAQVHLQEVAAEFLVDQGTIDEVPGEDRYIHEPLDTAIEELQGEVDWDPTDEFIELDPPDATIN